MLSYPIIIRPDGDYLLGFLPDFPECNPVGRSVPELLGDAVNALEEMIAARMADREPLPVPSPLPMDSDPQQQDVVELPALTALKMALYSAMRQSGMTKAELARRLDLSQKAIDRLLDLNHRSRLDTIERALGLLGRKISVDVLAAA